MGGDGGSIPGRQDLVRTKRKPEKADQNMERVARWHHCAITQERLREPIVSCELGRLYNKEAVLEYLLEKSSCDSAQHIKSLKDVRQLNLTPNPAYKGKKGDKGDYYVDRHTAPYICPVTGLEMNGKYRFCFLWNCGCVMSEKAFKEVKSDVCHKCGRALSTEDGILMNGTEDDIKTLMERMETRRALAKAEKKAKKAQKRKQEAGDPGGTSNTSTANSAGAGVLGKKFVSAEKNGQPEGGGGGGVGGGAPKERRDLPSRSSHGGVGGVGGGGKKPLDPKTTRPEYNAQSSKVYKSLFLPKDGKKDGESAHWVTYNPYYAMRN